MSAALDRENGVTRWVTGKPPRGHRVGLARELLDAKVLATSPQVLTLIGFEQNDDAELREVWRLQSYE